MGAPSSPFRARICIAGICVAATALAILVRPQGVVSLAIFVTLVVLAIAGTYFGDRAARSYADRIEAERRHRVEMTDLLDAARRSEQRYALAAAGSNDGLWDWDLGTGQMYFSSRWHAMLGLTADDAVASREAWLQHVIDEDRSVLADALARHLTGSTGHFEQEYRIRHRGGEIRFLLCRGLVVRDGEGRALRMAGSQTDVTAWRTMQLRLARAARHDPLTGLPNRMLFAEGLQREIAQSARRREARYAVLFVDLDGFKLINDSLGHLIGDQFLVAIAQRIQSRLRPGDSMARLGGDEFAVLVTDVGGVDEVRAVADRVLGALAEPFDLQGREIYASASIGVVVGAGTYVSVADLLRDADTAMYRAKSAGRGGYEIFDPAMHASAMARLTLENELRHAVERGEFLVYYQPIVELGTREICGVEALVRWERPDGAIAVPAAFIHVCEETGLIAPMTEYVLAEASRQVAAWQRMFGRPLRVSVNISPKLFVQEDLADQIAGAMAEHEMLPGTLCLEITESVLLRHSEVLDENFSRLRRMGVPVYLDDFGTGYSSLSYLQRYPVDALKLDGSFVASLGSEAESPIASVIATLARELGTGLIAEGVETHGQAAQLRALGCPHAQGELFSAPLPASSLEALLSRTFDRAIVRA